jgi:hypothetical protein
MCLSVCKSQQLLLIYYKDSVSIIELTTSSRSHTHLVEETRLLLPPLQCASERCVIPGHDHLTKTTLGYFLSQWTGRLTDRQDRRAGGQSRQKFAREGICPYSRALGHHAGSGRA